MPPGCLNHVYVRSSLCAGREGAAACRRVEGGLALSLVDRTTLPAVASHDGLPYDAGTVDIAILRVDGTAPARDPM